MRVPSKLNPFDKMSDTYRTAYAIAAIILFVNTGWWLILGVPDQVILGNVLAACTILFGIIVARGAERFMSWRGVEG